MEAFDTLSGKAVPLDIINVDTDQIIPKQFLKKIDRSGFGVHLFHDWRYLDDSGTKQNPEFVLNYQRFQGSEILLTRKILVVDQAENMLLGLCKITDSGVL